MFAVDGDFFEDLVGFDDFFHLGLDGGEVIGGDAVVEFDVVVEAIFDGWSVGELGIGPEGGDGGGHDVGAGVAEPLQVAHAVPVVEGFTIFSHS
ncbi:MAG: hypothetical protein RI897_3939 [Verrucomicrobiota bacterium]